MIKIMIFLFVCILIFYDTWVFPSLKSKKDFFIVVLEVFVSTLITFFYSIWVLEGYKIITKNMICVVILYILWSIYLYDDFGYFNNKRDIFLVIFEICLSSLIAFFLLLWTSPVI